MKISIELVVEEQRTVRIIEAFIKGLGLNPVVQTCSDESPSNADRIRAMSDEELADAIYGLCEKLSDGTLHDISNLYCDGKADCITTAGDIRCDEKKERGCVLRWLRQPVEEEST